MANEMQRGNLTGTAVMRIPISGTVNISGKQMKELWFMPYSEFPEEGREDVLYIDTDGNAMYYWDGTEYIALSGGGTGDYNELSNKPQINGNVLTGNKTAANLGLQETISDIDTIRSGAASGSTAVQPSTLATALATKQDVISDLESIRSGAASGATAVQPSDMETALADKQDVISDLSSIRSGAASGATAVQPDDMETALSSKQDVISDLSDIRSGASSGATAVQPSALNDYQTKLSGTNKLDPSYIDYDASHRAVSDTEKSTWNGKQDTISDLATIRSGAAAGATALQQSDVSSTYSASGAAPVNGTAVSDALGTLNKSSVGGAGKYISEISETNGEISATPATFDTSLSSSSTNSNAPTSKTVFDDQQRQEVEIGVVANAGAKNDFDIENLIKSAISENVTYSLSGYSLTASSNGRYARVSIPYKFKAGTTVFSAIVSEYSISGGTMYIRFSTESSSAGQIASEIEITNNGQYRREITVNADTDGFVVYYINGSTNAYVNSAVFTNNMIRPASITDSTFVPYALSNPVITPALIEQVNNGVKNLLRNTASSQVVGGVTFTVNADGTITANGTKTNNDWFYLSVGNKLKADTYVLSSGLAPQSDMSLRLLIATEDSLGSAIMATEGGRQVHTKQLTSDYTGLYYAIRILSGTTVNNVVFKPMLCTAADWAVSQKFVPYAPTNRELYEMIQALQNNS